MYIKRKERLLPTFTNQTQHIKHEYAHAGHTTPKDREDPFQASTVPAHKGCNDDTPCCTAAVSI